MILEVSNAHISARHEEGKNVSNNKSKKLKKRLLFLSCQNHYFGVIDFISISGLQKRRLRVPFVLLEINVHIPPYVLFRNMFTYL